MTINTNESLLLDVLPSFVIQALPCGLSNGIGNCDDYLRIKRAVL
jgi:hypothetical protein